MATSHRQLLTVLKDELAFLESGGYQTERARPPFMFQDSPTCLNFEFWKKPRPCSECTLTQLAPENAQAKKVPCRYIPLNDLGHTIDWFYRYGTQEEMEAAMRQWLEAIIARLERIVREETDSLSIAEFSSFMRRISL
jgi:hypothetical protein